MTDTRDAPQFPPGNAALEAALYLVATPIGNADDITLRALKILAKADVLAAEDTRRARKLMEIHGISLSGRPILPYHDHNGAAQRPRLLGALRDGKSVAYVSDAGTPLVADPGFALARDAVAEGLTVRAAPGPSAMLAALSVAGLPSDRFLFAGFPPPKAQARSRFFAEFSAVPATLIFFETPRRLSEVLPAMATAFGDNRQAVICRELTKKFEESLRGTLSELMAELETRDTLKGEVVILIAPPTAQATSDEELETALRSALQTHRVKDAAQLVSEATGAPRKQLYAMALRIKEE